MRMETQQQQRRHFAVNTPNHFQQNCQSACKTDCIYDVMGFSVFLFYKLGEDEYVENMK